MLSVKHDFATEWHRFLNPPTKYLFVWNDVADGGPNNIPQKLKDFLKQIEDNWIDAANIQKSADKDNVIGTTITKLKPSNSSRLETV